MDSSSRLSTLRSIVRRTTFVRPSRLSERLGVEVILASEAFQLTGSFKFRAAYNLASNVPEDHIIAASSGNFGQALALACRMLGKRATVVMPATSAKSKIDAVESYGGEVDLVDTLSQSRQSRVAYLSGRLPGVFVASAFDDELVIEGNSSLADDIVDEGVHFDCVIAPVGGGGLTSGLIRGFERRGVSCKVIAAEPRMANDASRSLASGELIANEVEPQTIADGARTLSLGVLNFEILRRGLDQLVEVGEEEIREGVRLLFSLANLKAEPTGALSIGALLASPYLGKPGPVVCVVSGGNCDADVYADILRR